MHTNTNMIYFMNMMKAGGSPEAIVMNMLQESAPSNPIFSNILNLVQTGRQDEIEDVVRNIARERGVDFDREFNSFKQSFGL